MHRFTIVVERANGNFSAYVRELPGCITTGYSMVETLSNMDEAITLHLEMLDSLECELQSESLHSDDETLLGRSS